MPIPTDSPDSMSSVQDAFDARSAAVEVVVLIVSYNSERDLQGCLSSVLASAPGNEDQTTGQDAGADASTGTNLTTQVLVLDNASTDGSVKLIKSQFPGVTLIESEENLGFAGGNNLAWQEALERFPKAAYVALLNPDTCVEAGWLSALVTAVEQDVPDDPCVTDTERTPRTFGAAQSLLLLHDQPTAINTAGNRSHFLGFGVTTQYLDPRDELHGDAPAMDFPSGAAVLIRTELVRKFGLFDDRFFLYLEDADLGWKLRMAGYPIALAERSVVYHKYTGDAPVRHYYFLERNRWLLLLIYYRLPTLILLAPALLAMEFGQYGFALIKGQFLGKVRSCFALMKPSMIQHIWRRRRTAQRLRTVSDRTFTEHFTATIRLASIDNPVLRYIANPLMRAYWTVARWLLWW